MTVSEIYRHINSRILNQNDFIQFCKEAARIMNLQMFEKEAWAKSLQKWRKQLETEFIKKYEPIAQTEMALDYAFK